MADRIKTNLDEDLHEHVLRVHRETGKSKSQIVNELVRDAYDGGGSTVESFWSTLGQSLFVVGPILALFGVMAPGLGVMAFGLGLMLWGKMQTTMSARSVGPVAALRITLGM